MSGVELELSHREKYSRSVGEVLVEIQVSLFVLYINTSPSDENREVCQIDGDYSPQDSP